MAYCTNCGKQNEDGATFCTECGTKFNLQNPVQNNTQQNYHQPIQNNVQSNYQQTAQNNAYQNYQQPFQNNAQQSYQQPPQNNAQQSYQQPTIMATPVSTNRSIIVYILLSIITCGIYGYYFIYKLAKDVNQMCSGDGDHVGGLLAYILLSFVTCGLYSFYWLYKIQNRLHTTAYRYGVAVPESGTTVLVWLLVGALLCGLGSLYGIHIVFKSANNVGMAYNARIFNGRV